MGKNLRVLLIVAVLSVVAACVRYAGAGPHTLIDDRSTVGCDAGDVMVQLGVNAAPTCVPAGTGGLAAWTADFPDTSASVCLNCCDGSACNPLISSGLKTLSPTAGAVKIRRVTCDIRGSTGNSDGGTPATLSITGVAGGQCYLTQPCDINIQTNTDVGDCNAALVQNQVAQMQLTGCATYPTKLTCTAELAQ